jgi:hypothetical protein
VSKTFLKSKISITIGHKKFSKFRNILVGLSSGNIPDGFHVGDLPNTSAIEERRDYCWLSSNKHPFEWPNGSINPEWKWNGPGDVNGCGLLLNPENKLSIFFTRNGVLLGQSPL